MSLSSTDDCLITCDSSCQDIVIHEQDINELSIECSGKYCFKDIEIHNNGYPIYIECNGDSSCKTSKFQLSNTNCNASITCSGFESCIETQIAMQMTLMQKSIYSINVKLH